MEKPPTLSADLVLALSVCPCPAVPGQPLLYRLTAFNAGPDRAETVRLTCPPPAALRQAVRSLDLGKHWSPWSGTLELGALDPGQRRGVLLTGLLPAEADAPVVCSAALSSPVRDPALSDNTVTLATPVVGV